VPAIRPELFPKALASGADAICFDLEDGVPEERKTEAREILAEFLGSIHTPAHPAFLVRVNQTDSAHLSSDIEVAIKNSVAIIALPKIERVSQVQHVCECIASIERERGAKEPVALLLTIESPGGLRLASELAQSSPRVIGLQVGFADLLEPLGILSTDSFARNQIRLMLRLAAAEANVPCFEAAYPLINDEQGLLNQLQSARSLGFSGASCIHPGQIGIANRIFTPTAEEIEYAEGVVNAAAEEAARGHAIARYRGQMVDRPFLLRAKAMLSFKNQK